MSPYCDGPVPQLLVEKSSEKDADDREFEFELELVFARFEFELRLERKLLLFELMFARSLLFRLEILANEQAGLAMRIAARADQRDVRPERHVPGHFLPDEVEGVVGEPHVFAATGDAIASARRIEFDRAGATSGSDVGVAVEGSNRRGAGLRSSRFQRKRNQDADHNNRDRREIAHGPITPQRPFLATNEFWRRGSASRDDQRPGGRQSRSASLSHSAS